VRRADDENAACFDPVDVLLVTNSNQWRANETACGKSGGIAWARASALPNRLKKLLRRSEFASICNCGFNDWESERISLFVIVEMRGYQVMQLFLSCLLKMTSTNPAKREMEKLMKRTALVLLMIGSLTMAGQASAHGHGGGRGHGGDGGAIVGALIGGAVLGALVTSVANAQPAYAQPVYQQPAYAEPAYAQPVYAQPTQPPGYCYDNYRNAYVPCGY
jgi:hypothetical protein